MNSETEQKTENPAETQQVKKTPSEIRNERLVQIDNNLAGLNYKAKSPEEIQKIQTEREDDFESKIKDLETGLGQPLSEESKRDIYKNEVSAVTEHALNENKQFDKLSTEKTVLEYLSRTLDGEKLESFIESPMNDACKVAILIPAYNESATNMLRSLTSLSKQGEIDPSLFEVDFIVNNRQIDAEQKTESFITNQESINLLKYINNDSENLPSGLSPEQISQIDKIKKSGIKVNIIDKSSPETANTENNVGIARNRAGAEIAARFLETSKKSDGVIAITDCDCTFSSNYIKSLIESFEENKINGVSGNLEFEIDPELPNKELIQKAFDVYMGINRGENKSEKYKGEADFKIQKGALKAGADMAVTVKAWVEAGGMPQIAGGEDIRFGQNVENLKGSVAKNYSYTVTSLIRVSERTGLQGNGRIVKKIKESIDAFLAGNSNKIHVENRKMVDKFYNIIIDANQKGTLNGELFVKSMRDCDFKSNNISVEEYNELADEINTELKKHHSEQELKKIQELILNKIYPYYPEIDVKEQIFREEK